MGARGAGSIVVVDDQGEPLGIVTDRDLRSKVVARALTSSAPVSAVMSAPLVSVPPDTPAFEALLEMTRRNIHHLGVVEAGRLLGVVSSHDMAFAERAHPLALARAIEGQGSLDGLAATASRLTEVVRWLVAGGSSASEAGRLIAELNDRLVARAAELVERALEAEGHGRPPVTYSWLAAGSEARREQTLRTDQDNGLVYADAAPDAAAAAGAYFGRFASRLGAALIGLGFPECRGGFMASNPHWCQPAAVWRARFTSWMETPQPAALLAASVFFDLRPVAGDPEPGRALWQWICERAPSRTLFLRYLAREAVLREPGLALPRAAQGGTLGPVPRPARPEEPRDLPRHAGCAGVRAVARSRRHSHARSPRRSRGAGSARRARRRRPAGRVRNGGASEARAPAPLHRRRRAALTTSSIRAGSGAAISCCSRMRSGPSSGSAGSSKTASRRTPWYEPIPVTAR